MSDPTHYTQFIESKCSPQRAFTALTKEIPSWWGNVDNAPERLGDIFTVSWPPAFYRFQVIHFKADHSITWKCIDANQIIKGLTGVQKEWVGNELEWTIEILQHSRIRLALYHRGLTTECHCYDFCSSSWDKFLGVALKKYLEKDP